MATSIFDAILPSAARALPDSGARPTDAGHKFGPVLSQALAPDEGPAPPRAPAAAADAPSEDPEDVDPEADAQANVAVAADNAEAGDEPADDGDQSIASDQAQAAAAAASAAASAADAVEAQSATNDPAVAAGLSDSDATRTDEAPAKPATQGQSNPNEGDPTSYDGAAQGQAAAQEQPREIGDAAVARQEQSDDAAEPTERGKHIQAGRPAKVASRPGRAQETDQPSGESPDSEEADAAGNEPGAAKTSGEAKAPLADDETHPTEPKAPVRPPRIEQPTSPQAAPASDAGTTAAIETPAAGSTSTPENSAAATAPPNVAAVAAPTAATSPRGAAAIARLAADRALNGAAATPTDEEAGGVDRGRFLGRVEGAIRAAHAREGRVQVRLSPPELGSLRIELTLQQGTLSARVEAENQTTRNLLLENLPALRDRLAQHDVHIERFDVDVRRDDGGGSAGQQGARDQPTADADARRPPARRDAAAHTANKAARTPAGLRGSANDAGLDVRV